MEILRQTGFMVFNLIMDDNFASLFSCKIRLNDGSHLNVFQIVGIC